MAVILTTRSWTGSNKIVGNPGADYFTDRLSVMTRRKVSSGQAAACLKTRLARGHDKKPRKSQQYFAVDARLIGTDNFFGIGSEELFAQAGIEQ